MRSLLCMMLVAVLGCLAVAGEAQAQKRGGLPDRSIGLGFALQPGGHIGDNRNTYVRNLTRLDPTVGAHLHWDKLVLKRRKRKVNLGVSLGVLGRVLSWKADLVDPRNLLLDVAFRPRFVIAFKSFVFYLGPEVGPTLLSLLNKDYYRGNKRARPGVNVSFVALGFEWWWSPKFSLFTEVGWAGHWLYHDFDTRLSQALITLGINFGRR